MEISNAKIAELVKKVLADMEGNAGEVGCDNSSSDLSVRSSES